MNKEWQNFRGREAELEVLEKAWEKAKDGEPQCVMLLGDSGYGKTRIIHEFYRRIVEKDQGDSEGYWPDVLSENPSKSNLNPETSNMLSNAIPWLWWGMGWSDPEERRTALGKQGIRAYDDYLCRHAVGLINKRAIRAARNEVIMNAAEMVMDFLPLPNLVALPVTGRGVYGSVRDLWEKRNAAQKNMMKSEQLGKEEINAAIKLIRAYLDPDDYDAEDLPVILVFDDAQWADPATLKFAGDLYCRAIESKWPLLILVTHWEKDWKQAPQGKELPLHAEIDDWHSFRDVEASAKKIDAIRSSFQILQIGQVDGGLVRDTILSSFPSIQEEVIEHIIERCDGNMLICSDFVEILHSNQRWFTDKDPSKSLLPGAIKKFKENTTDAERRMEARLSVVAQENEKLYKFLSFGACQGTSFLTDLVKKLSERAENANLDKIKELAAAAENEHNIIFNREASAEFKHRNYRKYLEEELQLHEYWPVYRKLLFELLDERWQVTRDEPEKFAIEELCIYQELLEEQEAAPLARIASVKSRISKVLDKESRKKEAASYAKHAVDITAKAEFNTDPGAEAVRLNNEILWTRIYGEAFDDALAQTARSNYEMACALLPMDAPETSEAFSYFIDILEGLGRISEARAVASNQLKLLSSQFGSNHLITIEVMRRLAGILSSSGDHVGAVELYEKCLEARETGLGGEHYLTLNSMLNLATELINIREVDGRYLIELDRAESLYRRHLGITEQLYGDSHLETLTSAGYLQRLLVLRENFTDALILAEHRVNKLQKAIGGFHHETIDARSDYAKLLMATGDLFQAEEILLGSLSCCEKVLGEEHETKLRSTRMLAMVFEKKGELNKAVELKRSLLETCHRKYGPTNPETVYAMEDLAHMLEELEPNSAERLYGDILTVMREKVGPDSQRARKTEERLVSLWKYRFEHNTVSDYQELYEKLNELLGPEHEETLNAMEKLAGEYLGIDDFDNAERLYRCLLEIRERTSGSDHEDSRFAMSSLATCFFLSGKKSEACSMQKKLIQVCEKAFGPSHEKTERAREGLEIYKS